MTYVSDQVLTEELMDYLPLLLRALFHYEKTLGEIQLPALQLRVLVVLHRSGQMYMSEMAEHLGIQRQQLTKIIDALEEKGLVIRKENVDNRRMLFIEATPNGEEWCNAFIKQKSELVEQFLNRLSDEERLVVLQGVAILESHIKDILPD